MWYKKELPIEINNRDLDKLTAYIGQSYSDMNLVGQYENAVDILINQIIEEKHRVDTIAHPLLYLMRHSIELGLKENIKYLKKYSKLPILKSKTHTLSDLFSEFEKHYSKIAIENNFEIELKEEYNKYTSDLKDVINALGEEASSFRYVYANDEKKVFANSDTINVYELKKKYDNSLVFISHNADVISPYTDYIDYLKFDKSIKKDSLGFVIRCTEKYQKDWLIEKLNEKHKVVIEKSIWFDEEEKYFLHLKIANKKCYVIPMKKIIYYLCTMNKVTINKDKIIKSVAKMLSDKEVVRSYMKGKTSKNTLSKKGIKLPNHQLHKVSEHLGFKLENHHNVLADAKACAHIALNIF